jgi:hypothetical protein
VYLLDPKTGKIKQRLDWKGREVRFAESTPENMIILVQGKNSRTNDDEIVLATESGIKATLTTDRWCLNFRYCAETGLVYASHLEGVDVHQPSTGRLLYRMEIKERNSGTGLVDVKDNTVYILTGDGSVYACKHPKIDDVD